MTILVKVFLCTYIFFLVGTYLGVELLSHTFKRNSQPLSQVVLQLELLCLLDIQVLFIAGNIFSPEIYFL